MLKLCIFFCKNHVWYKLENFYVRLNKCMKEIFNKNKVCSSESSWRLRICNLLDWAPPRGCKVLTLNICKCVGQIFLYVTSVSTFKYHSHYLFLDVGKSIPNSIHRCTFPSEWSFHPSWQEPSSWCWSSQTPRCTAALKETHTNECRRFVCVAHLNREKKRICIAHNWVERDK